MWFFDGLQFIFHSIGVIYCCINEAGFRLTDECLLLGVGTEAGFARKLCTIIAFPGFLIFFVLLRHMQIFSLTSSQSTLLFFLFPCCFQVNCDFCNNSYVTLNSKGMSKYLTGNGDLCRCSSLDMTFHEATCSTSILGCSVFVTIPHANEKNCAIAFSANTNCMGCC